MAVESVKLIYPSEYEQVKKIIREVEAKLFSVKRETKKVAMEIQIIKNLVKNPDDAERLMNLREVCVSEYHILNVDIKLVLFSTSNYFRNFFRIC